MAANRAAPYGVQSVVAGRAAERALGIDDRLRAGHAALGWFEEAHQAAVASLQRRGAPCDREREELERGWAEGGQEGAARSCELSRPDWSLPPTRIELDCQTALQRASDSSSWRAASRRP